MLIINAAHKVSQTAFCFDDGLAFLNFTASKKVSHTPFYWDLYNTIFRSFSCEDRNRII